MRLDVPDAAVSSGRVLDSMAGSHTGKTMMLQKSFDRFWPLYPARRLRRLCEGGCRGKCPRKGDRGDAHDVLHLRHLYSSHDSVCVFAALRELWAHDETAQPLIALMCSGARDPLLRTTADFVLTPPIGSPVAPEALGDEVEQAYPESVCPWDASPHRPEHR